MEFHLHLDESSRSPAQTEDRATPESASSPHSHPAFDAFAQTCAIFPMEDDDFPDDSSDSDESFAFCGNTPCLDLSGNESWVFSSDDNVWDANINDRPKPDSDHMGGQPQRDPELECHEDEGPVNGKPTKSENDSKLDAAVIDGIDTTIPDLETQYGYF